MQDLLSQSSQTPPEAEQTQSSNRKLFTIRPLEWNAFPVDNFEYYTSKVMNGRYEVYRGRKLDGQWGTYTLEYCFEEYFDEGTIECDSLEDGKEKAWQDFIKRITPALIPVPTEYDKPY